VAKANDLWVLARTSSCSSKLFVPQRTPFCFFWCLLYNISYAQRLTHNLMLLILNKLRISTSYVSFLLKSSDAAGWMASSLKISDSSKSQKFTPGFRKTCFFKKPNPLSFWVLSSLGFYCIFKLVGWFSSSAKILFRFASNKKINFLLENSLKLEAELMQTQKKKSTKASFAKNFTV